MIRARAIGASVRLLVLAAPLALAACADIPDLRDLRDLRPGSVFNIRPAAPLASTPRPPASAGSPSASRAEAACLEAGSTAGFDVRGVVGTEEVVDAAGAGVSRNVMLRVQRGGRSLDVRCSYEYASDSARIMTL